MDQIHIMRAEHALRDAVKNQTNFDNCASQIQSLVVTYVVPEKQVEFLEKLTELFNNK